jgi:carboxypeptidase C (cathepsin A)
VLSITRTDCLFSNTPSVIRQYDNLPWRSQSEYRLQRLQNWYWTDETGKKQKGGGTKGLPRLQVVTVNDAGHTTPAEQRIAVTEVVGRWLTTRNKTFNDEKVTRE